MAGDLLCDSQMAYRPDVGLDMAHMLLHAARDAAAAERKTLLVVKLDVKSAYDNVRHDILWARLAAAGMPEQVLRLLQHAYQHARAHVSAPGGYCTVDSLHRQVGLLQGCPISPILYNLYIAPELKAMQEHGVPGGVQLTGTTRLKPSGVCG